MNALRVFRYGLLVGRQEFAIFWTWRTWAGGWMLRIVTTAAAWGLVGQVLDSPERLQYLLIGNAVLVGPLAANWTVPASTWDRNNGTYPLLVIAPSSLLPAIMGRTAIWLLNGVATSTVTFVALALVFQLPLPMPNALVALALMALPCISTWCLALSLGSLVTRNPRIRNTVHNTATTILMAFAGVSVPVSFWPEWVQALANLLPVTHGLAAIRLTLAGGDALQIAQQIVLELAVGLGWLTVSLGTMDRMANQGRADGSIEFV